MIVVPAVGPKNAVIAVLQYTIAHTRTNMRAHASREYVRCIYVAQRTKWEVVEDRQRIYGDGDNTQNNGTGRWHRVSIGGGDDGAGSSGSEGKHH